MMISSKTKAVVLVLWIVATASHLVHAQPTGGPGDRFVPMGHSYDTSNRQLPTLNSYDDQVNNRADTIKSQIYREQRERAYWEHQLNSTHGTHLGAKSQWPPGY